jgi:hypothetical protein
MREERRVKIDPEFVVAIPRGWEAEADEEGGVDIAAPEGPGLLHLIAFPQEPGEFLDPAEELYIFLEDQGVELEEDEVEDLELAEGQDLALCEYLSEDEGEGSAERETYWMVGVATAPGNLVFCSYSCPAEQAEAERETVRSILGSLRLRASD